MSQQLFGHGRRPRRGGARGRRRPSFEVAERRVLLSFSVSNANDSGPGSLRAAIYAVDNDTSAGTDVISPDDPGALGPLGPIVLSSPLPPITRSQVVVENLVIDGNGTGGGLALAGGDITVEHIEVEPGSGSAGVYIPGGGDSIAHSTITGNAGGGLVVSGGGNQAVSDDISLNGASGVDISGPGNQIGQPALFPLASTPIGDHISGNDGDGIYIHGAGASGNRIWNNWIGVTGQGSDREGNAQWGIFVDGAPNTVIGGVNDFQGDFLFGNVVSANQQGGVAIRGADSTNELVEGNEIGTDVTGTLPLGNGFSGIYYGDWGVFGWNPTGATIGGTAAGARNLISNNGEYGVWITGSGVAGAVLQGNFIGTDATGRVAMGNGLDGVRADRGADRDTIGGTVAGASNFIAANDGDGIDVSDAGTFGLVIQGDLVGTAVDGQSALGNHQDGVQVQAGAEGTVIGGSPPGAGDVISGNGFNGIDLNDALFTPIQGNTVGLNRGGTAKVGNGFRGIGVEDSPSATVGGTTPGAANVDSGNSQGGITIAGAGSSGTLVQGNVVGLGSDGATALGNAFSGILVSTFGGAFTAPSGVVVGGDTAAARNVVSSNKGFGVWVTDPGVIDNVVEGNVIGADATGTLPRGNGDSGVHVGNGSSGNMIGGAAPGAGNLIDDNPDGGVVIQDPGTTGNLIAGNIIGLDRAAAPSRWPTSVRTRDHRRLRQHRRRHLGRGARNVIAGNVGNQVALEQDSQDLVEGNYIGVDERRRHRGRGPRGLHLPVGRPLRRRDGRHHRRRPARLAQRDLGGRRRRRPDLRPGHRREPGRGGLHRHRRHGAQGRGQRPARG